ncbi:MAG: hypothetical protein LLF83_03470 [Methanobacterium sp.]|nr:hypothetical protein [Methanobacterium sp.]
MKSLIYVLVVVSLVVAISGCTSDIWATNKTYSGNGITFTYPGAWESDLNKSVTMPAGSVSKAIVGSSDEILDISTVSGQNLTSDSLQQVINDVMTDFKNKGFGSEKNITVDGATATMITSQKADSDGFYTTYVAWVKNNTIYYATYLTKSNSTANLEKVLSTFKTT